MHVVVETWTPRPAFLATSPQTREAFFEGLNAGMAEMAAKGIESLGWGTVEPSKENGTEHSWFAVWRMPDAATADAFLAAVAASGWYDYFEQTNVRGELRSAGDVIAEHVALASR